MTLRIALLLLAGFPTPALRAQPDVQMQDRVHETVLAAQRAAGTYRQEPGWQLTHYSMYRYWNLLYGTTTDDIRFFWRAGAGGTPVVTQSITSCLDALAFDSARHLSYIDSPIQITTSCKRYSSASLPDSLVTFEGSVTSRDRRSDRGTAYSYLPDGRLARRIDGFFDAQDAWTPRGRTDLIYDSKSRIDSVISLTFNAAKGSWERINIVTYRYNAAGRLVFKYSAGTGAYEHIVSYDAAGRIAGILENYGYPGGFRPENEFGFGYDSAGNMSTVLRRQRIGTKLEMRSRLLAEYDSDHLMVRRIAQTWTEDGWKDNIMEGTETFRYARRYEDAAGAGSRPANAGNALWLAPVPADGRANATICWTRPQAGSLAILDMGGRVLREWKLPALPEQELRIETADLPTGLYLLRAAAGALTQSLRFAVRH